MVGFLGIVVSPFRPTSRIERRGPHYHVEAARRWCSACGHPLQDSTHLLLDCPAFEPLWRAIFGTTSSIFDLWSISRPWGVARLLGRRGVPPRSHPLERLGSTTMTCDTPKHLIHVSTFMRVCGKLAQYFLRNTELFHGLLKSDSYWKLNSTYFTHA